MSIQIHVNTETMSAEEARSLAIFFLELRGIPREGLVNSAADDASAPVAESDPQSAGSNSVEGPSPQIGEGQANPVRRGPGRTRKPVEKVSPVFVLENKATNAQVQCDTGRKGDVEAAKGHLESWIRDASSPEEVAQLASVNTEFVATCLTKNERLAISKLITEVSDSFKSAAPTEAAEGETKYTLDAVKVAGKTLATAKGLPAVETVLAKYDSKTFRDIKEADYAAIVKAFEEALQ